MRALIPIFCAFAALALAGCVAYPAPYPAYSGYPGYYPYYDYGYPYSPYGYGPGYGSGFSAFYVGGGGDGRWHGDGRR